MAERTVNGVHEQDEDAHPYLEEMEKRKGVPNRLVLCFDGTGNSFAGNTSDTNIVKLVNKLKRDAPHQMLYYQPGIGTYTADGSSINTGFFGGIKRSISQLIDAGFATTFDSHVIAGYRFLMRYYSAGDRIYIFGFSRGAFTARFLARMVSKVGLLSRGNEEMVPFAYKLYQDCEMGKSQSEEYIHNFKHTFCRGEHLSGEGNSMDDDLSVKVHFLGLFDTVNSVGTFDVPFTRKLPITTVGGTAEHVRHAVAIDERRVKFKASLLAQDVRNEHQPVEDIKEVWFSGNHGDIGGGWPAVRPEDSGPPTNARRKARSVVFSQKDRTVSKQVKDDPFQLSDITLKWMIDELDEIGKRNSPSGDQIEWNANKVGFLKHYEEKKNDAMRSHTHDTMKFGGGGSWTSVLFWKMMEYLPFIKRWENIHGVWKYVSFPLNRGGTRDIPAKSVFHPTVKERIEVLPDYNPTNDVSVSGVRDPKPLKEVQLRPISKENQNLQAHF